MAAVRPRWRSIQARPAAPSSTEIRLARIRPADCVGDGDVVAGGGDQAASRIVDQLHRLALGIGRDDDRTPGGEDAVDAARDDIAGEAARKAEIVDIRCRERLRQHRALLIREEAHVRRPGPGGELDGRGVARSEAHDHDHEAVEVLQRGCRLHERPEVLGVPDVAGVHDDEAAVEPVLLGPSRCCVVAA